MRSVLCVMTIHMTRRGASGPHRKRAKTVSGPFLLSYCLIVLIGGLKVVVSPMESLLRQVIRQTPGVCLNLPKYVCPAAYIWTARHVYRVCPMRTGDLREVYV